MIELKKKGQSINLSKKGSDIGEVLVNLNWNQSSKAAKGGGFLSSLFGGGTKNFDLDLGCLFELNSGEKGCVQALGNAFGSLNNRPYIQLDHDDRTGASAGGENLRINGSRLADIKRVLVYAFIYEGAANWSEADGVVRLTYSHGEEIVVKLDEHRNGQIMCAIAMIENVQNETFSVKRLVEYFPGHKQMDRAYNWGMNWVAGSK
ncbi:TerD family protein [Bacillus sp. PK3_68]|uniref:TerD family protein n=1 Tax=Pseudobacillus sp. FSL P4-0506 TaxID=2921576 RepID=UPI000E70B429|nr:TerD family protein [Bacillus sp. PK3_68]RJS60813.1 Tellurium resistance [Bacillus sp. PK3_68]